MYEILLIQNYQQMCLLYRSSGKTTFSVKLYVSYYTSINGRELNRVWLRLGLSC